SPARCPPAVAARCTGQAREWPGRCSGLGHVPGQGVARPGKGSGARAWTGRGTVWERDAG
ncbi:MAG: hypothetical protein LBT40_00420, partial [Deltaproteobacteria bacterium]|nr:hypothetical protein [Deltaproteobacteria bacterium]